MTISFPNPAETSEFRLTLIPDEGIYKSGRFTFLFKINNNYPHEPPRVKCEQRIYHPNLDIDGNICLNILREDWKPVLTLQSVMMGLQFLFLEPNSDDPLNKEAANDLRANKDIFTKNVRKAMKGSNVGQTYFDQVL